MARKMICNLPNRENNEEPNCTGVILHQISPRMVQVGRQGKQRISIVGENWSSLVTCPKCCREHNIVCRNGKINEDGKEYEEITPDENHNPGTDPNNPNEPGQMPAHAGTPTPPADDLAPTPAPVEDK